MTTSGVTNRFAWSPSPEQLERANVHGWPPLGCDDYASLHRVSLEEPERFWRAVADDLRLELAQPWERVLDDSRGIEWTTWFEGARLNVATACVHVWAERTPGATAAVFRGENGDRREWTFARALPRSEARWPRRCASARRRAGRPRGDLHADVPGGRGRLACVRAPGRRAGADLLRVRGAGRSSQRLQDSGAKAVITADYSLRRGRACRCARRSTRRCAARPRSSTSVRAGDATTAPGRRRPRPGELPALEVEAEHPYLIAYTSGTTGRPKGAVHVHGGFLLSIAREAAYQTDVQAGDRVLFATDMGWIMGPWTVVGAGRARRGVVYTEGAPDRPDDRLWRLVEEERVTMLGVSPTLIRALIPKGEPAGRPRPRCGRSRRRASRGTPAPYDWLHEHACGGGRIPIVNISGGTEVGACFLSVTPMAPTKPVSLGFPALGQAMDVFSPEGEPLRGEVGRARLHARRGPG